MVAVDFNAVGHEAIVARLKAAERQTVVQITRAMERSVRLVERELKENQLGGKKGSSDFWGVTGAEGNALGSRSGAARRSITARVIQGGGVVIGIVGGWARYLRIQERGGTIAGSPMLRIPTRLAQTGAGVDKNLGRSVRGLPGLFIFKSQAGNAWIATRSAGQLQLLYLLKPSVTLRARRMFATTLSRSRQAVRAEFARARSDVQAQLRTA